MNHLEWKAKYLGTFYQISCKDNKILKLSTRFGDLCLLGAILRYILEGFPPNEFPRNAESFVLVNVSTNAGNELSGIHNPLRQRHFPKSPTVKHSPPLFPENTHNLSLHKTLLFEPPVSRFDRSMFYFAVQVSAHLWAVSDRSWDTSKYLKGLAQKFKFFQGIWWLCATFR